MSDSIKVAIKIRPLIKREKKENLLVQWEVQDNTIFSVDPETKRRGDHSHVFDHIFGMHTTNSDVYDAIVKPIVEASVRGFNGTIFAYGQTGSGKTHTMIGTVEEPGIIPLAIENMFDIIADTSGREFLLRVSYLEIYNERVNDLLHKNGVDLKIHEDINGQVIIKCKEEVTNCPQNVLSIMKKGEKQRRTGETNMNERSSRSHTIFRIIIESRETSSDADGAIQVSQLNLVDLAGSERVNQTGATGDRFKEGRHINLSLTTLSLVIMQLSESKEHVNFRDSKLTRILQASLGGNAMTTIICAVAPAALEETQSSLAFASRAKSVKNKPQVNEVMSDAALLKRYSKQIAKLHAELEKERQTNRCAKVEIMESQIQEQTEYIQAIEDRMKLLQTRIVSSDNSVENVDFKTRSRRRRTWGGPSISGFLNQSVPLPTIQEATSTEKIPADSRVELFKSRKSIIHTPRNEIKESLEFQTEIADFEFDLMESARNWEMGRFSSDSVDLEDNYYVTKRRPGANRIKFQDELCIYPISENENFDTSPAKSEEPTTPPMSPQRDGEKKSGTPKEVLRDIMNHLVGEYAILQEFTTIEKQLFTEEKPEANNSDNMEAMLRHMRKSVTDSEMLCLEANKKYSDLRDKYLEMELKYEASAQDNEVLKKQIETMSYMVESLKAIESEKSKSKADIEMKLQKLQKLEEERNDHEFQLELLESKHKTRQKELENSLQIAWKASSDMSDEGKASNILNLQSLVDNLTKEVEILRSTSEATKSPLDVQSLLTENETLAKKLEEYEIELKNERNEKMKLMKEFEELERQSAVKSKIDRRDEMLQSIQLGSEQSFAAETEPVNETLSEGNQGQKSEGINSCMEVTQNSLSQKDCNGFDNSESIKVEALLNNSSHDLIESEKLQTSSMADPENESISALKITLGRLTLENENLVKENAYSKAQVESLVAEMKELKIIGEKLQEVTKELEYSLAAKANVETELAERDSKLQELRIDIHKLKDHIVNVQSEKTLWEGEKCAMEKIINENAALVQQIMKLEAKIEDLELEKKEFERTVHEVRHNLNAKCLELESIGTQNYESEIRNLKSYTADLEHLNKNIRKENEELKYQLQNQSFTLENNLDDLTERIAEQEKITRSLEEDKKKLMELLKIKSERGVSVTTESSSAPEYSEDKLYEDAKDDSSIFANYISFDEMEVSVGDDSTLLEQSTIDTSLTKAHDKSVTVAMLKRIIKELEDSVKRLENSNTESIAKQSVEDDAMEFSNDEVINKLYEFTNIRTLLEGEKKKLAAELQLKIQESDEIKNDVKGLRLGIEKLEQTIHLLTSENMEMSNKLTVEKDRAKEADIAYQMKMEELQRRVSEITEEKVSLASELKICKEHLDTLRANTPTGTEDEVRVKIEDYQKKIDLLSTENIDLSTELMDKIEELDRIKESNGQDRGCLCKYEVEKLTNKLESLSKENIDLSTNLMDKIEESDSLKHACKLLEDKLAVSIKNQLSSSINASQNELTKLRAENCQLKISETDISPKLTTLTNENDKLLSNYSEASHALGVDITVDEKLLNKSSQLSQNCDNSSESGNSSTIVGDVQMLKYQAEAYRLQVNELTRLNKELSDLKSSSCAQCNHLKEFNDSRKSLKLKVRNLDDKLEDLRKEFARKCADTDILRSKAREELNSSTIADVTLNGSVSESMNVTYVEEKMQSLNSELVLLKQNHEKLYALYKNKCSEDDKLNDTNLEESLTEQESDPPALNNNRARIERVQGDVDKLREEIQLLKKRNTALSQSLEKFINEKSNLQTEIETLKESKEKLNTELKNSEVTIEKAYEGVSALENEVADLNKQVDSLRKTVEDTKNEKLKIEVEIEVLKTEKIANQKTLEHLNTTLESEREDNAMLKNELQILNKETAELRKENVSISKNLKTETNDSLKEDSESTKLSEMTVKVEESQEIIKDSKHEIAKLTEESSTEQESDSSALNNNKIRMEHIQGDVDKLREEIQLLEKRNAALSQSLEKFMNEKSNLQTEMERLKESKEKLNTELKNSEVTIETAYKNLSALENEVADLNKQVDSLRKTEEATKSEKFKIEVEIEVLKTEKIDNEKALEHLNTILQSEREDNAMLKNELKILNKETAELRKENVSISKNLKTETNDSLKEDSESSKLSKTTVKVEESQKIIKDLKHDIAKLTEENVSLIGQINALRQDSVTSKTEIAPDFKKLEKELRAAKAYISKEIRSFKPQVEPSTLLDKTVNELLIDFLKIIMQKEQEIIKTLQDRFEREKLTLEDAKRQSVNAERRVTSWAKELETDIEKLQSDLLQQEKQNAQLKMQIERLENDLKESNYEKQLLKEKIETLESDFNALQTELAKRSDVDNKQGKEAHAMQERERIALGFAKNREIELQNCIKSMKDQYNRELGELTFTLEQYKSKNFELKSNLEGLEANECQLKSIIALKSTDLVKLQQRTSVLEMGNAQMSETCNQLNEDNQKKDRRIEEITNIVKIKCDKLSEYKTKLESILPEYEMLKEQINERKYYAEKYKNEYESFREKAGKELDLIKDNLSDERIKSSSLNEQLMELNGKNKLLLSELGELKGRCEDLEKSNEKLVKKVRNSTTNSRIEAQIEDLKDQNAVLQKSVEGASNRITELQESKNSITKDLISLQKKYEMLVEEKMELEGLIGSGKSRLSSFDVQIKELRDKLEDQIQEKNKIALELEATKLAVAQKEKHLAIAQEKIEELNVANKELDEELDAQAQTIRDYIHSDAKLRNIISDLEVQKEEYQNMQLSKQTSEVEIIINQNRDLRMEIKTISKTLDSLQKENVELKAKITDLESKRELRTCNSSRSSSPLLEDNRRKQRRSDLYNRGRSLDESSNALPSGCRCVSLSQKVRELELEIVSKNGKIATLELQIQSENFPYQKKCRDLEGNLLAFKKKNGLLKEEIKNLQRAMNSTSADECEVCKKWQMNKRNQSTQCSGQSKTFLSGTSSGFVEEYAIITKLEKEKTLMRDLCRSRTREIESLQKQISEYEARLANKPNNDATIPVEEMNQHVSKSLTNREKSQISGKNTKRAMKENLSANILDNASAVPSYRGKSLWDNYP